MAPPPPHSARLQHSPPPLTRTPTENWQTRQHAWLRPPRPLQTLCRHADAPSPCQPRQSTRRLPLPLHWQANPPSLSPAPTPPARWHTDSPQAGNVTRCCLLRPRGRQAAVQSATPFAYPRSSAPPPPTHTLFPPLVAAATAMDDLGRGRAPSRHLSSGAVSAAANVLTSAACQRQRPPAQARRASRPPCRVRRRPPTPAQKPLAPPQGHGPDTGPGRT